MAAAMAAAVLEARDRPVALFTAVWMLLAAPWALHAGNREFVFYEGILVLLAAGILVLHRRVQLQVATLWCLSAWGLTHMAGGLVPLPGGGVLYGLWLVPERLRFDQVVHAFGFGVTTWVCWQSLAAMLPVERRRPSAGRLLLCAAAGMGFGAANEVIEFAATLLLPATGVGGYRNTGWDLVANLAGAALACLGIALFARRHPDRS